MANPSLVLYWLMNGGSGNFPTVDLCDILNYEPLPAYVNLMATELNLDPVGRVHIDVPHDIKAPFEAGKIKALRDRGIKVALTIINNRDKKIGWSTLTREQNQDLIGSLSAVRDLFEFDGIDLDDEDLDHLGSPGNFYNTVAALRQHFPSLVISNPICNRQDVRKYQRHPDLADLMTYCSTMYYGNSYDAIINNLIAFHKEGNIPYQKLCAGIQPGPPQSTSCAHAGFTSIDVSRKVAAWAKAHCMGVMIYSFSQDIVDFTACPQHSGYPEPDDHAWQKAVSAVLFS